MRRRHARSRSRPFHHRRHAGEPDEGDRSRRRRRRLVAFRRSAWVGAQPDRSGRRDARKAPATRRGSTKARLLKIKEHFAKIRPRYAEFESKFIGVETEIFDSQIPGGMISNMESQLKQQGAGDRLKEVLAEVPHVRRDAGFPPLVTPSSQIVGTQAVFNVLMGRYKALTGEFADLMLGYYGETIGPRDPAVIEVRPAREEGADHWPPRRLAEARVGRAAAPGRRAARVQRLGRGRADPRDVPAGGGEVLCHREQGPANLGRSPTAAVAQPRLAGRKAEPAASARSIAASPTK